MNSGSFTWATEALKALGHSWCDGETPHRTRVKTHNTGAAGKVMDNEAHESAFLLPLLSVYSLSPVSLVQKVCQRFPWAVSQ